jgi:hypothetical protein
LVFCSALESVRWPGAAASSSVRTFAATALPKRYSFHVRPTEERLREIFNTVSAHVEERCGVPVVISDVVDPFTGDLDGSEIHVDYANSIQDAVSDPEFSGV